MKKVGALLGTPLDLEAGSIPLTAAHAWIEVWDEDALLVLDGKNNIAYRCSE
jgi:hypothetical protein